MVVIFRHFLWQEPQRKGIRYFFGGRDGVAERAAEVMRKRYQKFKFWGRIQGILIAMKK